MGGKSSHDAVTLTLTGDGDGDGDVDGDGDGDGDGEGFIAFAVVGKSSHAASVDRPERRFRRTGRSNGEGRGSGVRRVVGWMDGRVDHSTTSDPGVFRLIFL